METRHIVIIGGGFGGINLLKQLTGISAFTVTLVDRNNYNFFPPLMYQVATGYLQASNISYPFRKLLRKKKNIRFQIGELLSINPEKNIVLLSTGELQFDYLVIATGVSTNYFGMENVKKFAFPMKSINEAIELRNHILQQVEFAAISDDESKQTKHLNIVIAGGGPTGIEISGMLADMRKYIFAKDYPELKDDTRNAQIYLVDGQNAILKSMSERSQHDAYDALTGMGVKILLDMTVKDYDGDIVVFSDGKTIETKTLIWAAGVSGSNYTGIPAGCYGRGNRLITDEYNRVKGFSNIFAIGDCSLQLHELKFPNGHPQVAQVGIQQGVNLAHNLNRMLSSKSMKPFGYSDRGSMAIIGRNRAVVDLPGNKVHFKGFIAWFMWLFVHLASLISADNRVTTFYRWVVTYFTKDQSLRMIIRPSKTENVMQQPL